MVTKPSNAQLSYQSAKRVWDSGLPVYTPRIKDNTPTWETEIPQIIAAILQVGWRLDTWAVVSSQYGFECYAPLFIRPGMNPRE